MMADLGFKSDGFVFQRDISNEVTLEKYKSCKYTLKPKAVFFY